MQPLGRSGGARQRVGRCRETVATNEQVVADADLSFLQIAL